MEKKTFRNRTELIRTIKFVLFSISAGVIEICAFTVLYELLHLEYWVAYLVALVLSVVWNFTLNREFTFRSAANMTAAMAKVAGYYAVFTPVTTLLGNYLEGTLGWNGMLVTLLNMALNFVTEYLFERFVVFGKSLDTNKRAQTERKRRKRCGKPLKRTEHQAKKEACCTGRFTACAGCFLRNTGCTERRTCRRVPA